MGIVLTNILELRKITYYRSGETVLENISLTIASGKVIVVRGRTGVGKTTLAKIAALLLKSSMGQVFFMGEDVTDKNREKLARIRLQYIGYVDQSYKLIPTLTILENITLPLSLLGHNKEKAIEKALRIMKELGIKNTMNKYPTQVSGGQRQRAAIARALIKNPKLLVLDEPFSNLDEETTEIVYSVIQNYAREKRVGVLITTTDLYTKYNCDEDYLIKDRKLYSL